MNDYVVALGLTLGIEAPCYAIGMARFASRRWREGLVTAVAVNLVSHPIAFLLVHPFLEGPVGTVAALVVTELAVVFGEGALLRLRRIRPQVALATSACANLASLALGAVLIR